MKYKVGDKLLCKKDFIFLTGEIPFSKGERVIVDTVNNINKTNTIIYITYSIMLGYWFSTKEGTSQPYIGEYFYTVHEERKLKLKKLEHGMYS